MVFERQMEDQSKQSMQGKVCVVTGATSGIGYVTARDLARMGARVVMAVRNEKKAKACIQQIEEETDSQQVDYLLVDLLHQDQVRSMVEEFKSRYDRLDVLIDNAGAYFWLRKLNEEGIERTFALNHLGHFLLTNLLLDVLKASAPARIVVVSSESHRTAQLKLDKVQKRDGLFSMRCYGESKLANLLFTHELARRLEGSGVTANALHPGFVATNMIASNMGNIQLFAKFAYLFAITPDEGAQTSIYLASSPEVEGISGKYFYKCKPEESAPQSYDEEAECRLWEFSAKLTGPVAG
jgi:NAD(P)-dependent dehydrogenase (short-subunit alcohol dehydrogenase family)